ncbi:TetR/AcrR family transcriptional regulator [Nonomuraea sp. NPDC052265]|uniref:TetR/AcrR family transcriptional regulator n=1 Tax=Nonomuraea sp. NPDC052265 TaxID=3364374 RepID=UPI0037CAD72C
MARAGLTADRVTEAAGELADEAGFDNLTVSALARRFGVADASLYSHVRNLQDLRVRVALRAARIQADALTTAVAGKAGKDALAAFAAAYRDFALTHPGLYEATQLRLDPEIVAGCADVQRIFTTTNAVVAAYGLPEPAHTDAIRLLRSTFHGFTNLEARGGFQAARDVRQSWEAIIDALDSALGHWQVSP